jgi:TetR/AcrR family tetracycline transcriptional repressor
MSQETATRGSTTATEILEVSDRIVRGEGLQALTIRRLCDEIGVGEPTIYWHVKSKAHLVMLLLDRIVGRVPYPGADITDWTDQFFTLTLAFYDEVSRYHGIPGVMASELPTPAGLRQAAYVVKALTDAGMDDRSAVRVFQAVTTFLMGSLLYADAFRGYLRPMGGAVRPRTIEAAYEERLGLVDGEADLVAFTKRWRDLDATSARADFAWGLRHLIDSFRDL